MLRSEHSEFVDEGVWSSSRDILIEEFLGNLIIITEDGREGPEEDTNLEKRKQMTISRHNFFTYQLPELLDEPLGAGCQDPVGLRYEEKGSN